MGSSVPLNETFRIVFKIPCRLPWPNAQESRDGTEKRKEGKDFLGVDRAGALLNQESYSGAL